MSEIKFFELKCQRCGGELERKEEQGAEIYVCKSCGKTFEKQIMSDVADQLRSVLDEQKQEAVANLRQQLWAEMHEQYINSAKIVELSRGIKKYLPDDYFANFCEIANSGNDKQVNAFLRETSKENMADYADVVLDFMLKSLRAANITELTNFIEKAFKGDTKNYDKYITRYEDEAQKVSSGIYELTLTRNVFLAYSSKDIDKVLELCDYLERNKITCFLALRNLRHGRGAVDNYDKALKTAIDNCQTVVFVSSNNSRDMTCDALIKELPYIKKKDFENAPPECKRNYYKIPTDVLMPRVQYLIEDYKNDGSVAEGIVDEFFHDLEWCRSKEEVARRVSDYLTSDHETTAQKAEREKREAEQKLEEERRKAEEERRKAKELELRIAEMQVNATAHADSAKTTKSDQADGITQETFNGKKLCKKCKKTVNLTAKFCPDCGSNSFFTTYEEYLASKIKFCSMCGAQNNAEDKFCAECGSTKFLPTEKDYRDLAEKRKEEERQQKLREEEERKRREEEERQCKLREEEEKKRKAEEARKRLLNIGDYKDIGGGYITFGVYPQSKKACNVQIFELIDNERGYYLGSDYNFYKEWNGDYYQIEPIKWKVLRRGGEILVVAADILDACRFDPRCNNYANSEIRGFINNEFYNTAFNDRQKSKIVTTVVDNSLLSTGDKKNQYVCGNTKDKVLLLSRKEVEQYLYSNEVLRKKGTDYAKARGIYVANNGNSCWWLHSPSNFFSNSVHVISCSGSFDWDRAHNTNGGVVPALQIKL